MNHLARKTTEERTDTDVWFVEFQNEKQAVAMFDAFFDTQKRMMPDAEITGDPKTSGNTQFVNVRGEETVAKATRIGKTLMYSVTSAEHFSEVRWLFETTGYNFVAEESIEDPAPSR